ncbi:hypothetical protein ACFE04_009900 [Oxalis oulophora]
MKLLTAFFIFSYLFTVTLSWVMPSKPTKPFTSPNAMISVMGFVYCDTCSNNTFSKHSYFLPGAKVAVECQFGAVSSKSNEKISFSVNRTTNKHGMYKMEIPSLDGIVCTEAAITSYCQAKLIGSSSSACNVPGHKTTTDQFAIKSKEDNLCIYSFSAMNFKPSKLDISLCKN